MRIGPTLPVLLVSLSLACTDGGAPEQAAQVPAPSQAEPADPASEPPPESTPAPLEVEQPPALPRPEGWTIQYMLPLDREVADESLRRFTLRFSVHGQQLNFRAVGEFSSAAAAQVELDRLIAERPPFKGFIRDLSHCNLVERADATFECLPVKPDTTQFNPLVIYPPPLEAREDSAKQVRAEPLSHPPADAVLVVASDEVFKPGHVAIDRAPRYRTWIWTPGAGPLPGAIEQLDGLFVFARGEREELVSSETSFSFPQCDCSRTDPKYNTWEHLDDDLYKTVRTLEVVRGDGTRELLLTPAAVPDVGCVAKASSMQADYQVVAVAGPRVFVVERQRADECGIYLEIRMYLRVFDLEQSSVELAALERELPATEVARLRERAAWALGELMAAHPWDYPPNWWYVRGTLGTDPGWAAQLWPDALELSALFLDFWSGRESKALTLQYQLTLDSYDWASSFNVDHGREPKGMREGSKDWSTWTWTTRVSMPLHPSSSLSPPEDAKSLIDHVNREHRDWKVIGWSRRVVQGTSTAVETELPDI